DEAGDLVDHPADGVGKADAEDHETGSPSMRVNPSRALSNGSASHGWSLGPVIGVGPGVSRTPSTRQSPSTHERSKVTVRNSDCGAATLAADRIVTVHTDTRASVSR